MMLIADSGSTKTDWVLTDGNVHAQFKTIGYNPYFLDAVKIYDSLRTELAGKMETKNVGEVYFYGAGCSNDVNKAIVKTALKECFGTSEVWVGHDMLAAARALLGKEKGFAAILGTGANTCVYDGEKILRNIDSLGFLLGDEGSGAYIGKKVLRDFLRGFLPRELEEKFREKYTVSESEIYQSLYHHLLPNRFLAGFCEFASEHKSHEHIRKIIETSFDDFFRHLVVRYPGYENYTFNCIGAVGFIFSDILKSTAQRFSMKPGKIIRSPISALLDFHLKS